MAAETPQARSGFTCAYQLKPGEDWIVFNGDLVIVSPDEPPRVLRHTEGASMLHLNRKPGDLRYYEKPRDSKYETVQYAGAAMFIVGSVLTAVALATLHHYFGGH